VFDEIIFTHLVLRFRLVFVNSYLQRIAQSDNDTR
jgi:hypothetical protein